MANHKSAEKRHRQSIKRRERNRLIKSSVRSALKDVRTAIKGGDKKVALDLLRKAESLVAKASAKGVFHKRNASRRIGRMASAVQALG